MNGPVVPDTAFTEKKGVIAVARAANDARCLWRETPTSDVGIDGQIEYVLPPNIATGRIVAVQVKSGSSYFRGANDETVPYSPKPAHREYWGAFRLPVILVLHDPDRDLSYWVDARAAVRDGNQPIRVPLSRVLDREGVLDALCAEGPLPEQRTDPRETLAEMIEARTGDPGFDVSFFDLFFNGLTDIARSVYFGMDLVTALVEYRAWKQGVGWGIGGASYAFLDEYVGFLIARNLALVDFDSWRHMSSVLGMTGTFIARLTAGGRELVEAAASVDAKVPHETEHSVVARERPVSMEMLHLAARTDHIERFKAAFTELASD